MRKPFFVFATMLGLLLAAPFAEHVAAADVTIERSDVADVMKRAQAGEAQWQVEAKAAARGQ
jgi:predicted outer membrane lipoprotein